ncbi:MAG: hypothetical protein IJY23_00905 [Clostridia bacterium]|nr:hypothetical protein [Clostridia bacterium]
MRRTNMKKLTKALLLVLSLAVVCAGLIMVVSADAGTSGASYVDASGKVVTTASLTEAFENAKADTVITLTGDTEIASTIFVNKNLTLNLGGYTLTSGLNSAFRVEKSNVSFTITGDGTVNTSGALVYNATKSLEGVNVSVVGAIDGITVNHTGEKSNNLIYASSGAWSFKNISVSGSIAGGSLFCVPKDGSATELAEVDFSFAVVNITANTGASMNASVIQLSKKTTVKMDYCSVETNSNLFFIESQTVPGDATSYLETGDFIVINNSTLTASCAEVSDTYASDGVTVIAGREDEISVFGGLAAIGGNIKVKDSTVTGSFYPVYVNGTYNDSAVIFENSTLTHNGNNAKGLVYSANVVFDKNSTLNYTKALSGKLQSNTKYTTTFTPGVRVNATAYNALSKDGGLDGVVFKGEEEIKYRFVHSPDGNYISPYVVKNADSADEEAVSFNVFNTSPSTTLVWNPGGETGKIKIGTNDVWKFKSNGTRNANGSVPTTVFGLSTGVDQSKRNVFVYDVDFATDGNGFPEITIALHARTSSSIGSGSAAHVTVLKITEDGVAHGQYTDSSEKTTTYLTEGDVTSVELNAGDWNHLTAVIDTTPTKGKAYIYVNGVYVGSCTAYTKDDSTTTAYLAGPRFDIQGVDNEGKTLLIDNVFVRTYGDGTSSSEVVNNGQSYLLNGGKAMNADLPVSSDITLSGIILKDVNEALAAYAATGVMPKLLADASIPQIVTESGKILANGYTINVADGSVPYEIELDEDGKPYIYTFDKDSTDSVNFEFIYQDSENAAKVEEISEVKSGVVVSALVEVDVYNGFVVTREDGKKYTANFIGWSTVEGSEAVDTLLYTNLTFAYVKANNGATVNVYPVYEYVPYHIVNFKFFTGDIASESDLADASKYTDAYSCIVGEVPSSKLDSGVSAISKDNYKYDGHYYTVSSSNGWSTELNGTVADASKELTLEYAAAHSGETVNVYPTLKIKDYTWVIEDANGNYVKSGTTSTFYGSDWNKRGTNDDGSKAAHLYSGQVFLVHKDGLEFAAPVNPQSTAKDVNATQGTLGGSDDEHEFFNFDLNGHLLYSDWRSSGDKYSYGLFQPDPNDTYNVYSSRPGAQLIDVGGYKENANKELIYNGGDLFRMNSANSTINVGTVTVNGVDYPGSNLTVSANAIVRLHTNSPATATVNIDGCTLIQGVNTHADKALVYSYSGTTAGTANIKNATIVLPLGGYLVNNMTSTSTSVLFENCTIIAKENGDNLIKNSKSGGTITFDNCVTNGSIGADVDNAGTVIVKNTAAFANAYDAPEGYVNAKFNVKMTLGEGVESFTVHSTSLKDTGANSAPVYTEFVVSAESLPILANKVVKAEDALTVTYKGLGDNTDVTVSYAVGGNVEGVSIDSYSGNLFKFIHDGGFEEAFATNLQANATYTPTYTLEANVTGIKTGVTFNTDFKVNIYIPFEYSGKVTLADGSALFKYKDANGNEYLRLKDAIEIECDEVTDEIVFNLTVKDTIAGVTYTLEETLTVSILDYAKEVLSGDYTDAEKVLVYYALNYANEASKYFGGSEDVAVAETLTAYKKYRDMYSVNKNYAYPELETEENYAPALESVALNLTSNPDFVLTLKEGVAGTVTVTYGAKTATYTVATDGDRVITLEDVGVFALGENVTVTVISGGSVAAKSIASLSGFAKYHNDNAVVKEDEEATDSNLESAKCLDLIDALYEYVSVANLHNKGNLAKAIAEQATPTTPEETPAA